MTPKVTVDFYENEDKAIVFVNGFALVESGFNVAVFIANTLGLKSYDLVRYGNGKPTRETIEISS